jgi:DNA-binding transcriptional MerR regulator
LPCYTAGELLQELTAPDVDIPKRALFKPSEVCEIARVQPYVLRSWESEFPDLGITKAGSGQRVYRRADLERVLRIKHLVFGDGLTLAGVRRRIEEDAPTVLEAEDAEPLKALLGRNAKERLTEVKRGLQAIMEMLSAGPRGSAGATRESQSRQFAQVAAPAKRKNGARPSKPAPKKSNKRRR